MKRPRKRPMENVRYGYMCKIDFDFELGEAYGGNTIYPSRENVKKFHPYWKACGIVRVKITQVREGGRRGK